MKHEKLPGVLRSARRVIYGDTNSGAASDALFEQNDDARELVGIIKRSDNPDDWAVELVARIRPREEVDIDSA